MDFSLNDQQKLIRDTVRQFMETEVRPLVKELEREEKFPLEIIKKLGEMGCCGMLVPEEWGGPGLDTVSYVLMLEEVARVYTAMSTALGVTNSAVQAPLAEFGTEQHPAHHEWFYGVPYEKPEGFLNSSPFLYVKNAKTPTLILQGDSDTTDPLGQSQELYRGLKRYGVEAELVVYPREPHGFHEEKHLLDLLNRILAWYDKHMKAP